MVDIKVGDEVLVIAPDRNGCPCAKGSVVKVTEILTQENRRYVATTRGVFHIRALRPCPMMNIEVGDEVSVIGPDRNGCACAQGKSTTVTEIRNEQGSVYLVTTLGQFPVRNLSLESYDSLCNQGGG